jgi:metallo-beta-lactamase family protein
MHVQCLGAAGRVTGSCHLIEAAGFRVLLDCGLIQGGRKEEELNRQPFPFDPARIDAVVLSHAHIDHSGRIPLLVKNGFTGTVYAHKATRALSAILLKDAGFINEHDAQRASARRREKGEPPVRPLYTSADGVAAMENFSSIPYNKKIRICPSMVVRFQDAGHILGSCIVEIWATEGAEQRKLVFSGDLGHVGAPIMKDPALVHDADLVLMESTYGDRDHRSWDDTRAEVMEIAAASGQGKGNILIPSFAVGRSQMLLYWMAQHYTDAKLAKWQIFLDSPLAIRATSIYARHIDLFDKEAAVLWRDNRLKELLPNLHFARTAGQSRALNSVSHGAVIIAGSGMCTGGRITHHLFRNVWRKECHVIVIGYQANGTPGRALVDGAARIRLFGESVKVAATIHTVGGLSAHAGQAELLRWYDGFKGRPPLVLVHGETSSLAALKETVQHQFAAPVHIARAGDRFDLAKPIPF